MRRAFLRLLLIVSLSSCNRTLHLDSPYLLETEVWKEYLVFYPDSTFKYLLFKSENDQHELFIFSRGYWMVAEKGGFSLETSGELLGKQAISVGVLDLTGALAVPRSRNRLTLYYDKYKWTKMLRLQGGIGNVEEVKFD